MIDIGTAAGFLSGLFGIGGGIVIVPALIYHRRLYAAQSNRHQSGDSATADRIVAVLEYYRNGNVDVRAGAIIAVSVFIAGGIGAVVANRIAGPYLRLAFGIFVVCLGCYLIFGALKRLRWM